MTPMNRRWCDPHPFRLASPEMLARARQTLTGTELTAHITGTPPPVYSGPAPVNPLHQEPSS